MGPLAFHYEATSNSAAAIRGRSRKRRCRFIDGRGSIIHQPRPYSYLAGGDA